MKGRLSIGNKVNEGFENIKIGKCNLCDKIRILVKSIASMGMSNEYVCCKCARKEWKFHSGEDECIEIVEIKEGD